MKLKAGEREWLVREPTRAEQRRLAALRAACYRTGGRLDGEAFGEMLERAAAFLEPEELPALDRLPAQEASIVLGELLRGLIDLDPFAGGNSPTSSG